MIGRLQIPSLLSRTLSKNNTAYYTRWWTTGALLQGNHPWKILYDYDECEHPICVTAWWIKTPLLRENGENGWNRQVRWKGSKGKNLNVVCPSDRVQNSVRSERLLMAHPDKVKRRLFACDARAVAVIPGDNQNTVLVCGWSKKNTAWGRDFVGDIANLLASRPYCSTRVMPFCKAWARKENSWRVPPF